MTVLGDRHAAWLRAMIDGHEEDGQRLTAELAKAGSLDPLIPLLNQAFSIAIRQAFGDEFTREQVIRVVAALRAVLSETPVTVDPVAAESEIRRVLGDPEPPPLFPDADARWVAQTALLGYVVRDLELDPDQIGDLISQACLAVTAAAG